MNAALHTETEGNARAIRVTKPEPEPHVMTMTEAEFTTIETGIDGAQEVIRDAGEVFDYLATALACGYLSGDDATLSAILRMAARATKAGASPEIAALEEVEKKLRITRLSANGGYVK